MKNGLFEAGKRESEESSGRTSGREADWQVKAGRMKGVVETVQQLQITEAVHAQIRGQAAKQAMSARTTGFPLME